MFWVIRSPSDGALSTCFQLGVCSPDFRSVGLVRGILWTEIFKFGGLRAKILAKIEAVEGIISNFVLKRGSCELTFKPFCLKWDPCNLRESREKGGLQGRTSTYPLPRSVPPQVWSYQRHEWSRNFENYSKHEWVKLWKWIHYLSVTTNNDTWYWHLWETIINYPINYQLLQSPTYFILC